jgi:hypothetical protein
MRPKGRSLIAVSHSESGRLPKLTYHVGSFEFIPKCGLTFDSTKLRQASMISGQLARL